MKVWHTKLNISPTCESISIGYDTSNRSKNVFFKVSSCVDFQGRRISDGSNGHLCDMRYRARVWYYIVWLLLFIQCLQCFSSFSGKVWKFWWTILERQHHFLNWRVPAGVGCWIRWYLSDNLTFQVCVSIRWTTAGSIITRTGCINWSGVHPPAVSVGVSGTLNSDMKASPTVSNPYSSHPDLSKLRNWPLIVQLSYLFRSMLSLQLQQTLLLAALLLTRTMMMIIRSPKWEIYHLTLWNQLKVNWIGGRGWDSCTCQVHLHQSLVEYVRFLLNLLVTCSVWEFWCTALVFRAARLQLIIFKRTSLIGDSCVLIIMWVSK